MKSLLFPTCTTILCVTSFTESLSCSLFLVFRCKAFSAVLQQWASTGVSVSAKHNSCNENLFLP